MSARYKGLKTFLLVIIIFSLNQQNNAQVSATIVAVSDTVACESGEVILKITFTGTSDYYGFALKREFLDLGGSTTYQSNPIEAQNLAADQSWTVNLGFINERIRYTIYEVYDDTSPNDGTSYTLGGGNKTGTGSVSYRFDKIPFPSINILEDVVCGYTLQLDASKEYTTSHVQWSAVANGTFSDNKILNPVFIADETQLDPQQFILTLSEYNGTCIGDTTDTIFFNGMPRGAISGDFEICKRSDEISLNISLEGNQPWKYIIVDGEGREILRENVTMSSFNDTIDNVIGNKTYQFGLIEDVNGCSGSIETTITGVATIKDVQPIMSAGVDQQLCDLKTFLEASTDKGVGEWSSSTANISFADSSLYNTEVNCTESGQYTLVWTVSNDACINTDEVVIDFSESSIFNLLNLNDTICEGNSSTVNFELAGESLWQLEYTDGVDAYTVDYSITPSSLVLEPNVTTTYIFSKLTNDKGCETNLSTGNNQYEVFVEKDIIAFAGQDSLLDKKYTSILNANSEVAGYWILGADMQGVIIEDELLYNSTVSGLRVGENTFIWTTSPKVCESTSDEVIITVNGYQSYNGFSPNNGDDINNYFVIDGASQYEENELMIFDISGKMVYQTKNYDNTWDGVDMSGNDLDDGTYYFVFKSKNADTIKDFVVIRR